jgi:apolipoprotein N-acyltransferase
MDRVVKLIRNYPASCALLAGGLSATGFGPIGLWPVLLLCLAGLIALLHNINDASILKRFWIGYCFGFGQFAVGLNWMAHAFTYQDEMPHALGWFAAPLLSIYLAIFPGIAAAAASSLAKNNARALVPIFAGCWIIAEYLRSIVFTGFPWNPLSAAFVDIAQIVDMIGTYGASGIIILGAGAIYLAFRREIMPALLCLILPIIAIIAHVAAPSDLIKKAPVLLHIVQPNISQADKYRDDYEGMNFTKLASLTKAKSNGTPRLILWPEAAIPDFIGEQDVDALDARIRISQLMQPNDVLITGADKIFKKTTRYAGYQETKWVGAANSSFALNGRGDILWRYDKAHLVPFGEYVPLRKIMEPIGLSRLVPGDLDFWPGPGPRSLPVPGIRTSNGAPQPLLVGTQICYEIIFSGNVVDSKKRPDFIFNPSNDAWFGDHYSSQMMAQARLRAIEEGLPVIRSTPTGISAIIDAYGAVTKQLPLRQANFISGQLPHARPATIFARFGNIVPLGLAVLLILAGLIMAGTVLPLARRRTSR